MSKLHSGIRLDRIATLENELEITKAELASLKLGRSFRLVKFLRELKSSDPADFLKTIKSAPSLLQRYEPVKADLRLASQKKYVSSLYNSFPLLRYPNINVVTIGSLPHLIFSSTCNQFPLSSSLFRSLTNLTSAIQLVAIEASSYKKEKHLNDLVECINSGANILILYNDINNVKNIKKSIPKSGNIIEISINSLPPVIDIYELCIQLPKPNAKLSLSTRLTSNKNSILILDSKKSESINRKRRNKINQYIASGGLTIIKGETKPDWVSKELWLCKDSISINEAAKELSTDYKAEQYAIKCSRDTILSFNTLNLTESLLIETGLIKDKAPSPTIGVIMSTKRPKNIQNALEQIEHQSIPVNEVVLMLHGFSKKEYQKTIALTENSSLNIKTKLVSNSVIFGDVLNMGLDLSTSDLITKMDDDDFYLPNHLLDLYAAHLHSRADFVGKWNNWVYIESEDKTINWVPENSNAYVKHLPGATFLVKRSVLNNLRFGKVPRAIDSELYRRSEKRGAVLYSTHRYNFVRKRGNDHTYDAKNASFKSRAHKIEFNGLDLENLLSA